MPLSCSSGSRSCGCASIQASISTSAISRRRLFLWRATRYPFSMSRYTWRAVMPMSRAACAAFTYPFPSPGDESIENLLFLDDKSGHYDTYDAHVSRYERWLTIFFVPPSKSIGDEFGSRMGRERNEPGNGTGRRQVHCGYSVSLHSFSARIRQTY